MFHLLISSSGWPDVGGTMGNNRIYIGQRKPLGSTFYSNGNLDITKVAKIPALLVTEPGGKGDQIARVAYITSLTRGNKETTIQYAFDSSISPISNRDLEKYSAELRLGSFGLSHTCWDLCDVDLFKLLLRNQKHKTMTPKVFSLNSLYRQDCNLISVMMPYKPEFNAVYTALQNASERIGLKCDRADDIWEEDAIIQDVVNLIGRSKVVICDCSGKNPNVFYEAGIAHAIGKEVILIAQTPDDLPFDLRHLRRLYYSANILGYQILEDEVYARIKTIMRL